MRNAWSALVLVGAVLHAHSAAAQDPEEKRIPFQAQVSFDFHAIPLGLGKSGPVVLTSVPANTRLVITQFSARCETATSTTSLGPLTLSVTAPVFFGTPEDSWVSHWFPAVVQGNNDITGVGGASEPIYGLAKLWAASSPTHIYAGGGTKVMVESSLDHYDYLVSRPYVIPPSCKATISGYLVFPN